MSSPLRVFLLDVLISTIQSNRNLNGFSLPQSIQLKTSIYVYIAARKNDGLGGDITNLILMIIAGLMGFAAGDYSDLKIWTGLAVIIGLIFFIWHLVVRSQNAKAAANKPSAPESKEAQQTPSSSTQH